MPAASPIRLLLVGGGHAALPLLQHADEWTRRGVEVTLVDAAEALYYSGMVPEYLGGVYRRDDVRIPFAPLCAASGVRFVQAHVDALSLDRTVRTDEGETLAFDLAVFDLGSRTPGADAAPEAVLAKPLHRIEALESFVRGALGEARPAPRHLIVVGGGAAGTEVALNVSARVEAVHPGALKLTLVEPADSLLAGFPGGMQRDAEQRLRARGVALRLGARAERTTPDGVLLDSGEALAADCVFWATGTTGPALFREAGLPVTNEGFVCVCDSMQCAAAPWLFAAGDCAVLDGHPDLARVGVHAVKQGPTLRRNVGAALDALRHNRSPADADLRPFRPYPAAPLVLSTGDPVGLWTSGALWLRGGPVLRLKHLVDRRWMATYSPRWRERGVRAWITRDAAAVDAGPPFVS